MFRNAPRSGGASPAQIVFNRPVRDSMPAQRRSFTPQWKLQISADVLEKRARRSKELQVVHYNKKAHPLPCLSVGNHVIIQHPISKLWSTPGIIVEVGPHRDYLFKTPAGRIFRRNQRYIRRRIPTFGPSQPISAQQQPIQEPDPVHTPAPRRSTRPQCPRRLHFPNDWTQ